MAPGKTSDMVAMIGTLFLWIFWPSFCGVLTTGLQRYRVVVITLLALCGSCCGSFTASGRDRTLAKFVREFLYPPRAAAQKLHDAAYGGKAMSSGVFFALATISSTSAR